MTITETTTAPDAVVTDAAVTDAARAPLLGSLPLSAPANLRDLGGIRVAGGVVREGFALRADDLSTVTEEVASDLAAKGLRAVIDLRSTDECALTGRGPLGAVSSVSFHHIPFMADIGRATRSAGALDQRTFGRMYLGLVENAAPQIVAALAVIAYTPGTVAFHCAAGQDRTGVLAASLLLALGAERDDIVADYVRTGPNASAVRQRMMPVMGPLLKRFGFDLDEAARAALSAALGGEFSPEPMRTLIDTLTEQHGDPLTPLKDAGLTDGLIGRLRERALATV